MIKLPKTKTQIVKLIVGHLASYGAGAIISGVVMSVTPTPTGNLALPKKLAILIATAAITGMVRAKVVNYTDTFIDDLVSGYQECMGEIESQDEKVGE